MVKAVIVATLIAFAVMACASPAPSQPLGTTAASPTAAPTPTTAPTVTPTPTPEPTAEPTPTEEPTPAPPAMVPLGTFATVGDWSVRITKVNWNAAKALKAANMFNKVPPKGMTAVMIYVEGKYNGNDRDKLDSGYMFRAVGASGVEYTTFNDPTCGVLPSPDLDMDGPTVRKGATVKGWGACWIVATGDLKSLTAFTDPFLADEITEFTLR